jgi:hypothetical protein
MFEAGVDVDDSGYTACYEPTRSEMFASLHEAPALHTHTEPG